LKDVTLASLLRDMRSRFAEAGLDEPASDARTLIAGLLGLSLTEFLSNPERLIPAADQERIAAAIERRLAREPVFRILGYREFYGLELALSRETLEPRPDTEILVDRLLPYLQRVVSLNQTVSLVDFGTGTGAIALALLSQCPQAVAVGVDISDDALATARANAERLGFGDRFRTVRSNWADNVAERFDVLVSNPPYIARSVLSDLAPEVRLHDPAAALDGGMDGLDAYRALAAAAPDCLVKNGIVGLEIGYDQRESVTDLFEGAGLVLQEAVKDYGGNDRVLIFSMPG
jgi:release factor glutamine methyltransferase